MAADPRTPTLAQVISKALDTRLADVRVAMPARIESYDVSKQLADIQILLKARVVGEDLKEATETVPVLRNVPVMTFGGGGMFLSFPLAKGDTGLVIFSDRSMDIWKSVGGEVDPIDVRQHSVSDAIFIPGLRANPQALPDVGPSLVVLGQSNASADFVALASKVDAGFSALVSAFNTHVHPGGTIAGSTGIPSVLETNPATVASATVQVKG